MIDLSLVSICEKLLKLAILIEAKEDITRPPTLSQTKAAFHFDQVLYSLCDLCVKPGKYSTMVMMKTREMQEFYEYAEALFRSCAITEISKEYRESKAQGIDDAVFFAAMEIVAEDRRKKLASSGYRTVFQRIQKIILDNSTPF